MSDQTRLADLTGISEASDKNEPMWLVNGALVLVGASIVGVAFSFLDTADDRILYNPWTYAVATPIALVVLSAVLSTFVSRVVEKSMQLAFLLSVLIHLGLLAYAVNIIIFSKMWPETFQSRTQAQHMAKRQLLQAKQYVHVTNAPNSQRRPDYLRHVPTTHQPTEVKQSESPAIQLSRSETADLVSPQPELKATDTPHLVERKQPTPTPTELAPQTARLARNELKSDRLPTPDIRTPSESPSESATPEPLRAESAAINRSRATSSAQQLSQLSAQPSPSRAASSTLAQRAASPASRDSFAPTPSQLSSRQPSSQIARSTSTIPVPSTSPSQSAASNVAPRAAQLSRQLSSSSSGARSPNTLDSPLTASASAGSPSRASRSNLSDSRQLAAGSQAAALPRNSAGGRAASQSRISIPVLGPQQLANARTPSPLANTRQDRRLTPAEQGSAASGAFANSQSPMFDGQQKLGNSSGSVTAASRAEQSGQSPTQDIANLSGSARDIQRAALGAAGSNSNVEVVVDTPGSSTSSGADAFQPAPSELSGLRRGSGNTPPSDSGTLSAPGGPVFAADQSASGTSGTGLPSIQRASQPGESGSTDSAPAGTSGQSSRFDRRSLTADGTDGRRSAVDVPSLAEASDSTSGNQASSSPLAANSGSLRRQGAERSATTASNLLDIDAPTGIAGLSPNELSTGPMLARRSDNATPNIIPQLEPERFSRREIGGPIGGGQRSAVPKPAFQQRIDRLRDKSAQGDASVYPGTELAIERGLEFLARTQRDDGSWRLQDYGDRLLMRSDTAATGLSILAFQGAGYTHREFKYADNLRRAIGFLTDHQGEDGDLYIPMNPASDQNAWLYSHSIAALALCEAYGMTQDDALREPAQRSIDFIVASQDPQRGGWRYRPARSSDTSVSGWHLLALKSARLAGLNIPPKTMERLNEFLDESQVSETQNHLYRYNPYALDNAQQRHGLQPTAVMTSVGLLMRLYTGWDREQPALKRGASVLLGYLPEHGTIEKSKRDTYYWYYATQVMFHMRGQYWKQWHDNLYPLLVNHQVTSGEMAGSWDPQTPTPDLWARYGGRLYVTTMNLLSLEVSYRHLPLYGDE